MSVNHRRAHVLVAEQILDRPNIVAPLPPLPSRTITEAILKSTSLTLNRSASISRSPLP